jgi:hypothetical protein
MEAPASFTNDPVILLVARHPSKLFDARGKAHRIFPVDISGTGGLHVPQSPQLLQEHADQPPEEDDRTGEFDRDDFGVQQKSVKIGMRSGAALHARQIMVDEAQETVKCFFAGGAWAQAADARQGSPFVLPAGRVGTW